MSTNTGCLLAGGYFGGSNSMAWGAVGPPATTTTLPDLKVTTFTLRGMRRENVPEISRAFFATTSAAASRRLRSAALLASIPGLRGSWAMRVGKGGPLSWIEWGHCGQ